MTEVAKLSAAGLASGVPADVATFPFYRVNTVLQTQGANPSGIQYRGMFDAFRNIVRTDGFKNLYRGMPIVLLPGTAAFFGGMKMIQDLAPDSQWAVPLSGYSAQGFASLVFVPTNVTSEIQQMRNVNPQMQNMPLTKLVGHLVEKEGILVFYRGFLPQVLTFGTCHAAALSIAKMTKNSLNVSDVSEDFSSKFLINAGAYALSAYATNPLEVVKKYIQVGDTNRSLFPERSAFGAARRIWREQGVIGFKNGASARAVWLGSRMGLALTGFDYAYSAMSDTKN